MKAQCEVIGWVLVDERRAEVLILEENGEITTQAATAQRSTGTCAIQTGIFRRGKRIVDPTTLQTVGYEMEREWNPILALT